MVSQSAASNEFYLEMVAAQTTKAALGGNLMAKRPEIDLLLRLAGTTQISAAIQRLGAKRNEPFLLIVVGERPLKTPGGPGRSWQRLPRRPLSQKELEAIEDAALLNAERR